MNKSVSYRLGTYKGKAVIYIRFPYDKELIEEIKKQPAVRWSQSQKAWYVPDTAAHRDMFGLSEPKIKSEIASAGISKINQWFISALVSALQLKAYSPNTIRTYRNEFAQLLRYIGDTPVNTLSSEQLRTYFLHCVTDLKLSENTLHSRINAVKFYFEHVLGRERMFIEIPRPKKRVLLLNVLSISQVERLFSRLENLKHKAMLYLAHSAGLRVSEVVNLKVKDIHSERMVINIKGAKGKKDRTVALSQGILELLRKYYITYRPKYWLFEGQYAGRPYSARSLQQIFRRAKTSAGILQDVTFHSPRHSYATHLREAGTDIKLIQELLGHNDLKTTLRYTHVSNRTLEGIKSPFDMLNIKKNNALSYFLYCWNKQ